jgi:hypothetical protein
MLAVFASVCVFAQAFSGPATAASRHRGLERILEKSMFTAPEADRVRSAVSAALHAGVDDRDTLALSAAAVDGEFEAAQLLRLLSLASQLALEGLPVEGFIAKVEEGVAKQAPPDRVVQVAERRALMLNKAKSILNTLVLQGFAVDDRDELLPDVAAALEAGRAPEAAQAILAAGLKEGDGPGDLRRKLFP